MNRQSQTSSPSYVSTDFDTERVILGCILLDNNAFFDDTQDLLADDFGLDAHRRIYTTMNDILMGQVEGKYHVDIVTLAEELGRRGWINGVGGVAYLASLTEGLPRHLNVSEYVRVVKDKSMNRRIVNLCQKGLEDAQSHDGQPVEIVNRMQDSLAEILDEGTTKALPIGSLTPEVEKRVYKARSVTTDKLYLEMTWGIPELDQKTHGCFRGEFTVLAAESSGGKSALAAQIAYENARIGIPVVIFSLEMEKSRLAQRFYPLISPVLTAKMMRDPRIMKPEHIAEMQRVSQVIAGLPIEIDDTNPIRIDKLKGRIRSLTRKWKKLTGSDKILFILDYLSLIKGMPRLTAQERTENIVFTLRDLPKAEPDIHILALSQYSKGDTVKRGKGQQRSKDALFWGSVIHHASQNLLMLRVEDTKNKQPNDLLDAEIFVEKQREGEKGPVRTFFDRDHLHFGQPIPFHQRS